MRKYINFLHLPSRKSDIFIEKFKIRAQARYIVLQIPHGRGHR